MQEINARNERNQRKLAVDCKKGVVFEQKKWLGKSIIGELAYITREMFVV